jgi:polyphosphate kinase 2
MKHREPPHDAPASPQADAGEPPPRRFGADSHAAWSGGGPIAPVKLTIAGKPRVFDIDDPNLPDWISDRALTSDHFPYARKYDSDLYEQELRRLQAELVKVQYWLKATGKRLMALFEGRDGAGKDGTIRVVSQYLNPRSARIVALDKPTSVEMGQWYFQRYIAHFPTAGEIVLFNRSWYNRAGVEPVMGYCTPRQHEDFLNAVPHFEETLVEEGIFFFKFWLNIGQEMQLQRFHQRRPDPRKIGKLSSTAVAALNQWDAYTAARDEMLRRTHGAACPWVVVRANDKARAHLNVIRHLLHALDYEGKDAIGEIDASILGLAPAFLS